MEEKNEAIEEDREVIFGPGLIAEETDFEKRLRILRKKVEDLEEEMMNLLLEEKSELYDKKNRAYEQVREMIKRMEMDQEGQKIGKGKQEDKVEERGGEDFTILDGGSPITERGLVTPAVVSGFASRNDRMGSRVLFPDSGSGSREEVKEQQREAEVVRKRSNFVDLKLMRDDLPKLKKRGRVYYVNEVVDWRVRFTDVMQSHGIPVNERRLCLGEAEWLSGRLHDFYSKGSWVQIPVG